MFEPKHFIMCGLAAAIMGACPPQDPLQELGLARSHLLRGRYEEALEIYGNLLGQKPVQVAAAIGKSQCHESVGEWDEARRVIEQALQAAPDDPELLARKAEVAFMRGEWPQAAECSQLAIARNPNQFRARWIALQLAGAQGKAEAIQGGLDWFVHFHNSGPARDPETLVIVGRALVDHASKTLRGSDQSRQLNAVLNEIYDAALRADTDYWPALLWSGRLFLEKFRKGDALADLRRALAINPRAAEVHVALGVAALNDYEIEAGHEHADRALAINPNLTAARRLKADLYMAREQYAEALSELDRAIELNAMDEPTLGCRAACLLLQRRSAEFEQLATAVVARNPTPVQFWFTLAEHLEDHRRFDIAERYFKLAISAGPSHAGPQTGLGMLFMRVGKEKEAAKQLNEAFEMDPFNVRTKNMLEVLDQLDGYETITTEHFHVKVDGQLDGLLGRYAAKYLEEVFVELTRQFGYQPQEPIQIEIFNKGRGHSAHQWFSARTVGLPWIGTVGACTGRVVAMASPRGVEQPFNWARVLKHEVTHVITLQQTDYQIPHWFTEALAVQAEDYPRPQVWNQLLVERVPAGKLLNLDDINLAFARPKTALEWQLAYCQSELYAEYMKSRFGPESTARLLAAYRDGLGTTEAIEKLFEVSKDEFESGYVAHLRKVTAGLEAGPRESPMSAMELEQAMEKEPGNPDLNARLAGEFLKRRNYTRSRELALKATQLQPHHPHGSYVLARLALLSGDAARACELLEPALNRDRPDPRVLELLADLRTRTKDYVTASMLYALGQRRFPSDSRWVSGAARVAVLSNNKTALRESLEQLSRLEADDLMPRKKLASMAAEEQDWERAARFAWMSLHIDALDTDSHAILAEALAARNRWQECVEEYRTLQELRPADESIPLKLARAQKSSGDRDGAIRTVSAILEKKPQNMEARQLLDELKR